MKTTVNIDPSTRIIYEEKCFWFDKKNFQNGCNMNKKQKQNKTIQKRLQLSLQFENTYHRYIHDIGIFLGNAYVRIMLILH